METYTLKTTNGNKTVNANSLKEAIKLTKKTFSNKWEYIYNEKTFKGIYRVDDNYRIRHGIKLNDFTTQF